MTVDVASGSCGACSETMSLLEASDTLFEARSQIALVRAASETFESEDVLGLGIDGARAVLRRVADQLEAVQNAVDASRPGTRSESARLRLATENPTPHRAAAPTFLMRIACGGEEWFDSYFPQSRHRQSRSTRGDLNSFSPISVTHAER